jgi:hypothetical protein
MPRGTNLLQAAGRVGRPFEVAQFKGLTNLEFGTLWAIIRGEAFDFDKHALESLAPQEETWLFRFPDTYVQELATLTPAQAKKVAVAWASTDELQWEPSEAEEVLNELIRLSKLAGSPSKGLFFWGCV